MAKVLLVSDFFLVCVADVVWVSFYGDGGEWCEVDGYDDWYGRIW